MPIDQLLLFVTASLLLILTPGQDLYLVMTRSLSYGTRAGVVTAAGISLGLLGHTLLVAVGLGAVIQASDTLFLVLKICGALYLIWLGISALRSSGKSISAEQGEPQGLGRLFINGALSNLINPKVAVFYIAFLPQFVPPQADHPTLLLLFLGALFALLTFIIKAPIGFSAGILTELFRRRPAVQNWMNRISGTVLIMLGVRLLFAQKS